MAVNTLLPRLTPLHSVIAALTISCSLKLWLNGGIGNLLTQQIFPTSQLSHMHATMDAVRCVSRNGGAARGLLRKEKQNTSLKKH